MSCHLISLARSTASCHWLYHSVHGSHDILTGNELARMRMELNRIVKGYIYEMKCFREKDEGCDLGKLFCTIEFSFSQILRCLRMNINRTTSALYYSSSFESVSEQFHLHARVVSIIPDKVCLRMFPSIDAFFKIETV